MQRAQLCAPDDLDGFRLAVRGLVQARVLPPDVAWSVAGEAQPALWEGAADGQAEAIAAAPELRVPRRFAELAADVICHTDPARFAGLHEAVARLQAQPRLLDDRADPLVDRLETWAKAVRRDIHKMRAFLRFRRLEDPEGERYVAWFEPEHHIVRRNAGFFVRRFANMRWSILTPELSLHWSGETLAEGPGASAADAPAEDATEELWTTYYRNIFNPARLKIGAMLREMPRKYWKNMPETRAIADMVATAETRTMHMIEAGRAPTLARLAEEARRCTLCPLHGPASQTVFGEGPADARLMIVGEQPGDREDRQGRPFVGPAGLLLDAALAEAGVDRSRAYVTNAVKHFKFVPRGPRRIHQSPVADEIRACRWWLEQERSLVDPALVLMLGASAARALLDRVVAVGRERGRPLALPDGRPAFLTVHPSYLLRIQDAGQAADERARFVEELAAAGRLAAAA